MVRECKCQEHRGCPLCTHMYNCERCNESLSKHRAIDILESLNSDTTQIIEKKPKPKEIPSNNWMRGSSFPENSDLDKSVLKPQHEEQTSEYDSERELDKSVKYRGFAKYGY